MAPMSWEKVQTEESNRSILQFFNSKGTPLTKKSGEYRIKFGEISGINRFKGQDEKANCGSKGEGSKKVHITSAGGSQESFCVYHSS